jgi:hypothetical protein
MSNAARSGRSLSILVAFLLTAATAGGENTRIGDYNDDGAIVIACVGDSNTCHGPGGVCAAYLARSYCSILRDILPDELPTAGGPRKIHLLNFGSAGSRAGPSNASGGPHDDVVNSNHMYLQVGWALNLQTRSLDPRWDAYVPYKADVVIMAMGTNDYTTHQPLPGVPLSSHGWWPGSPLPDWWPRAQPPPSLWPRSPASIVSLYRNIVISMDPETPWIERFRGRAYVGLTPPARRGPENDAYIAEINRLLESLPEGSLIDFNTDFDHPQYRLFETDPVHVNTRGQRLRASRVVDVFCEDADRDCLPDELDSCPGATNPKQADRDGDGVGDACDACIDTYDPEQRDDDADGMGNVCDDDIDGDALPNGWELRFGSDVLRPDADLDSDLDGQSSLEEFLLGTDPTLADSDGDGWDDGDERAAGTAALDPGQTPLQVGYFPYEDGVVAGVDSARWIAVPLRRDDYPSIVVVATPNYDISSPPLVARIRNAGPGSFELRVERADGSTDPVAPVDVHYLVVKEGVYDAAVHGVTLEALTTRSAAAWHSPWFQRGSRFRDRRLREGGRERREYWNDYRDPVVLGQVMTSDTPGPSVFWGSGRRRQTAPTPSELFVGRQALGAPGEETLGYVVLESGSGVLAGRPFAAGVTSDGRDAISGVGDSPPYLVGIPPVPDAGAAVASGAGLDGIRAGWPVLYGAEAVADSELGLAIDTATARRSRHGGEQVAWLVASRDSDGDLVADFEDSCPGEANPKQLDQDEDGVGDACDLDYDAPYRTVVIFGDTQKLVDGDDEGYARFETMVQWVLEHRDAENIDFVLHTGDAIESGRACAGSFCDPTTSLEVDRQWERFDALWSHFDAAELPYAIVRGDHDNTGLSGSSATGFSHYFGRDRFAGRDSLVATCDSTTVRANGVRPCAGEVGHLWRFRLGSQPVLVAGLPNQPSAAITGWFEGELAARSDTPAIVLSHQGLRRGAALWTRFVERQGDATPFTDQIFMTVMGHFPEDRKEIVEIGCHGVLRVEFDYEYFDDLPTGASIARIRFHFDPASVDEVDGDTLSGSLEAGGNRLGATPFRVRNDIDCDGGG